MSERADSGRIQRGIWGLRHYVLFVAGVLALNSVIAQSNIYGYVFNSTTYSSLEEAEQAVRNQAGTNRASAQYSFPIAGNSVTQGWSMDYRPIGALTTTVQTAPQSISEPYFQIQAASWPPNPPAFACTSANNACSMGGWCSSPELELARVACQINATWTCPSYPGFPVLAGAYPAPVAPNQLSTDAFPVTDPSGLGRNGGAFTYLDPDCSNGSCTSRHIHNRWMLCSSLSGSPLPFSPGTEPAGAGTEQNTRWPLKRRQTVWCSPGLSFSTAGSTSDSCRGGNFKYVISPKKPKQHDQCNEGNPCSPGNGNKEQEEFDFEVGHISFSRYYNSLRELKPYGFFDANWSHSFGQRILAGPITDNHAVLSPGVSHIIVQNERAHAESFVRTATGTFRSVVKRDKVLAYVQADTLPWVIYYPEGKIERYDAYGRIKKIEYVNSYQENLSILYLIEEPNPANPAEDLQDWRFYAVSHVKDQMGRGILFIYTPDELADLRVTHIVSLSDNSVLASYQYHSHGGLWKATTPSGTREYLYAESGLVTSPLHINLLTGIKNEQGQRFSTYKYDSYGRVISSARAGDAGAINIVYKSDQMVEVTRPTGEIHTFNYRASDAFRRSSVSTDGSGAAQSVVLNSEAACSINDERICRVIDRNGSIVEYSYNNLFVTRTTEGKGTPQQRTIEDDRYGIEGAYGLKERRIKNAAGNVESISRFSRNIRGQLLAECEIDPSDSAALGYSCSVLTSPPVGAKVRRTVRSYCELDGVNAGTCPFVGFLLTVNGPRSVSDAGMAGLDDKTTYVYRLNDDPTCVNGGACAYRKGDLWKSINALGQVSEIVSFNKNGKVERTKDANGTVTDSTYHARGWLLSRAVRANEGGGAASEDAVTAFSYDGMGNTASVTQPDGSYVTYQYDDANRLLKITDNHGNSIDYCPGGAGSSDCLDKAGNRRIETIKDPAGFIKRSSRKTYNQLGQLASVQNAFGQVTESWPAAGGYDGNGNPARIVDGLGVETYQTYDSLNRINQITLDYLGPDSATRDTLTSYSYDTRGNVRSITDPDGFSTSYVYDGLNNLTGLHSPDTGSTALTYDVAGNRLTVSDARGVVSTRTYDAVSRLLSVAYPTSSLNVSLYYDQPNSETGCEKSFPVGRLTRFQDDSGSTTYCYDRRGNVVKKVQVNGTLSQTVSYTWSASNKLMSITYPGGAVAIYGRDTLGRITSIAWKSGESAPPVTIVSGVTYYPFGPLKAIFYGNGRVLSKYYDLDYAIDYIESSEASGLRLDFTLDVMKNVSSVTDVIGGPTKRTYVYDRLYRTKRSVNNLSILESYTYSKAGDRLSKATAWQPGQGYLYSSGTHRIASIGGVARTHDQVGNLTSAPYASSLTYDDRNRLSQVSASGGATTYKYNGVGERVLKQRLASREYALYDEAGRRIHNYLTPQGPDGGVSSVTGDHENGLELPGYETQSIVYIEDVPVAVIANGVVAYIETDHLGTPRLAANPIGNDWRWRWDFIESAFGENSPVVSAVNGLSMNLRYPGQHFDAETGVNYNYNRYYEPGTGRYIQSDPIGLNGGVNTYSYVNGHSFLLFDMLGLAPECGSKDCCGSVKFESRGMKVVGAIIRCCKQQAVICANPNPCDGLASDTCEIRKSCIMDHERKHLSPEHSDCTNRDNEDAPPINKNRNECEGYRAEIACLNNARCRSPRCRAESAVLRKDTGESVRRYCLAAEM